MTDDAIGREIRQLRADIKDDITGLHAAIAGLVSRDVHSAEMGRVVDRLAVAERELARLEREIDAHQAAAAARRDADRVERRSDRRMVLGAVIAAVLGILTQILRGTGTLP